MRISKVGAAATLLVVLGLLTAALLGSGSPLPLSHPKYTFPALSNFTSAPGSGLGNYADGFPKSISFVGDSVPKVWPLPSGLLFQSGSSELKPAAAQFLKGISGLILGLDPHANIAFTGHTDCVPFNGPGGNLALSLARAQAVEQWFSQHGFALSKMKAFGVGPTQPIAPDVIDQGRCVLGNAKNRTVVLAINS